jgi:5'(3')-deoxyribonucleotidase
VDFQSGVNQLDLPTKIKYIGRYDEVPGIFANMVPLKDALESFKELSKHFDTYILSTSPWENPTAPSDKLKWVKTHLGNKARKRLILTHRKDLNIGDFLVDDRTVKCSTSASCALMYSNHRKKERWLPIPPHTI